MSPEYDSVQLSLVVERQCQAAVAIAVNVNLVRPVMNAMKYTSSVHRFSDRTGLPHPRATSDIFKYYAQLRCSSVENLSILFLRFAASGASLSPFEMGRYLVNDHWSREVSIDVKNAVAEINHQTSVGVRAFPSPWEHILVLNYVLRIILSHDIEVLVKRRGLELDGDLRLEVSRPKSHAYASKASHQLSPLEREHGVVFGSRPPVPNGGRRAGKTQLRARCHE